MFDIPHPASRIPHPQAAAIEAGGCRNAGRVDRPSQPKTMYRRILSGSVFVLVACRGAAPAPPAPGVVQEPVAAEASAESLYADEDVTYTNPSSGLTLAGTLSLPETSGPHPAVLLISGSGAQDRDSRIAGHRPFAVLADAFARRGIAVLRVDDRGVGGSERGPLDVTSADFSTDVEAGVAFLRARPEIDPNRVALVGHSEGAMIAPMVAARDPQLAGIVLLAGPGVPGKQVLVSQSRAVLESKGVPPGIIETAVAQQEKTMAAIAEAPTVEAARDGVLGIVGDNEVTRSAIEAQIIPWTLYFVKFDPEPVLRDVSCPVLALGGTLDTQVVASENLPAIEAALREAGNSDVTVEALAGLNHLFQPAKTGDPDEYASSKVAFDEAVVQQIGDWLTSRLRP